MGKIADDSGELQWQRNTIVHGYIKGRSIPDQASPTGFSVIFYAVNKDKGKLRQVDLTIEVLDKLKHDISHLGGELLTAINRMGEYITTDVPETVIADRDFLRGQKEGNFQILPTWRSPVSLLQSFPVLSPYQWGTPLHATARLRFGLIQREPSRS